MVNDNPNTDSVVIMTRSGPGTGDKVYQTSDGRWWKRWDGKVKTGQEVRKLYF